MYSPEDREKANAAKEALKEWLGPVMPDWVQAIGIGAEGVDLVVVLYLRKGKRAPKIPADFGGVRVVTQKIGPIRPL
jgi:hypothetical protein